MGTTSMSADFQTSRSRRTQDSNSSIPRQCLILMPSLVARGGRRDFCWVWVLMILFDLGPQSLCENSSIEARRLNRLRKNLVAHPLLGVDLFYTQQNPHRQECLCYSKPPQIDFLRAPQRFRVFTQAP